MVSFGHLFGWSLRKQRPFWLNHRMAVIFEFGCIYVEFRMEAFSSFIVLCIDANRKDV